MGKVKFSGINASPSEVRFWASVDKEGPQHPKLGRCWDWIKSANGGYGLILVGSRRIKSHRYSYELHFGDTNGLQVLHKCDRPICVNPEHLFLGSQLENIADMVSKGRQSGACGESNFKAKLSERQVLEIRRTYRKGSKLFGYRGLAARFGVCQNTIQMIISRQTWRHL